MEFTNKLVNEWKDLTELENMRSITKASDQSALPQVLPNLLAQYMYSSPCIWGHLSLQTL